MSDEPNYPVTESKSLKRPDYNKFNQENPSAGSSQTNKNNAQNTPQSNPSSSNDSKLIEKLFGRSKADIEAVRQAGGEFFKKMK